MSPKFPGENFANSHKTLKFLKIYKFPTIRYENHWKMANHFFHTRNSLAQLSYHGKTMLCCDITIKQLRNLLQWANLQLFVVLVTVIFCEVTCAVIDAHSAYGLQACISFASFSTSLSTSPLVSIKHSAGVTSHWECDRSLVGKHLPNYFQWILQNPCGCGLFQTTS